MKTILSFTTIPPRFQYVTDYIENLKKLENFDEIWVNIPKKYNRFPNWDGIFPYENFGPKVIINTDCEDLGPGTSAFAPIIKKSDADILIVVNDDTIYQTDLIIHLIENFNKNKPESVWGLSGFNFDTYFKGQYPRSHVEPPVDVLEAYGSCMYKTEWLRTILPEFRELLSITWNDDMLISNLLEKHGIKRRTIFTKECNLGKLKQLEYGFDENALHHVAAKDSNTTAQSHTLNNMKILRDLEKINKNYFSYKTLSISYAITVCNESNELYSLISFLKKVKEPIDEINVLVDTKNVTDEVRDVLKTFEKDISVSERPFCGNFSDHRNFHNSVCKGDYIFVIDADEMPQELFIKNIKSVIHENKCELIYIPRINICPGFTQKWLEKLSFKINNCGWINWPDYQGRIYKNTPEIKWSKGLHEIVTGTNEILKISESPEIALYHIKTVERMTKQDEYYKTLQT